MGRRNTEFKRCEVCGELILRGKNGDLHPIHVPTDRKYCSRKCYFAARKPEYIRRKDRLYGIWKGMRERCNYPKHISARFYQKSHSISVCEEWNKDFLAFREWALANGYDYSKSRKEQSLDRIDNEKGYSPDNCRWVSMKINNQNTRRNVFLEYQGKRLCISEWSRELNIPIETIRLRINTGKTIEEILRKGD